MPAPKGNEYYLLAKNFVKPKKYQPKTLWLKAIEYFEWNNKHPLKEEKVFGTGKRMTISKMRAMTIVGFCNFACIDRKTYESYENNEAYLPICKRIKDLIYQQKLEGAAADLLNPSIIAREIGLSENTNQRFVDKEGNDIYDKMSNEEIDRILQEKFLSLNAHNNKTGKD